MSKFELRRIANATGAVMLVRYVNFLWLFVQGPPTPEEVGRCDEVKVMEISSQKVTIFKREKDECRMATIIVRASTNSLMDDAERTINDCVNTMKCVLKDPRFLPGAGAIEIVRFFRQLIVTCK